MSELNREPLEALTRQYLAGEITQDDLRQAVRTALLDAQADEPTPAAPARPRRFDDDEARFSTPIQRGTFTMKRSDALLIANCAKATEQTLTRLTFYADKARVLAIRAEGGDHEGRFDNIASWAYYCE